MYSYIRYYSYIKDCIIECELSYIKGCIIECKNKWMQQDVEI
jgi:hypothetical protein